MERYTVWRDAYTGLHPFLPYSIKGRSVLISAIVLLVRLVPAVVSTALLVFLDVLASLLTALLPLQIMRWTFMTLACRLCLVAWGFLWTEGRRLVVVGGAGASKTSAVGAGDLIIANHKSYWDLLYLASRYAPLFGVCGEDGIVFVQSSLCRAVANDILHDGGAPSGRRFASLKDALTYAARFGAPLVLFPESVSSNHEKCVLKPSIAFEKAASQLLTTPPKSHYIFFTYGAQQGTAAYTGTSSLLWHAMSVLSTPRQMLRVDSLDASQAAACVSTAWFGDTWSKGIQLASLKQTALSEQDRRDFLAKWYASP